MSFKGERDLHHRLEALGLRLVKHKGHTKVYDGDRYVLTIPSSPRQSDSVRNYVRQQLFRRTGIRLEETNAHRP